MSEGPESVSAVIGEPVTQPLGGCCTAGELLADGAGDLRSIWCFAHI